MEQIDTIWEFDFSRIKVRKTSSAKPNVLKMSALEESAVFSRYKYFGTSS